MSRKVGDVAVSDLGGYVTLLEIQRAPNNFFDHDLIRTLADIADELDDDGNCRAIVLASEGKHFCAGADFANRSSDENSVRTSAQKKRSSAPSTAAILSIRKPYACFAIRSR